MAKQTIHAGLDLGSVSVKLAVWIPLTMADRLTQSPDASIPFSVHRDVRPPDGALFRDSILVLSPCLRHAGELLSKTSELLEALKGVLLSSGTMDEFSLDVRATGSGGKETALTLGLGYANEYMAAARGMALLHPEVRTILEMGGASSKFIRTEKDADGSVRVADYEANGECAAGTGLFFDQQVERLEVRVEDVGALVRKAKRTASIAGRCSVFAKSDMIHAQQRGFLPPEILKGLCEAVARNFKGSVLKGKGIVPRAAFIGGVSANAGVVDAFRTLFGMKDGALIVPEFGSWTAAIGASLMEVPGSGFRVLSSGTTVQSSGFGDPKHEARESDPEPGIRNSKPVFPHTSPLSMEKVVLLRHKTRDFALPAGVKTPAYLGIDVGSVSTNLALITENGELIHGIYVMTRGKPVEVAGECLREMEAVAGGRIDLRGAGATGSGRDLVGLLAGADVIKDEITAHKTGAVHVSKTFLDGTVDTIFEVGGQDSKFISLNDGVVVDFCLNEACAAGTGSFLEEQAGQIGVQIRGEFSGLALRSKTPLKLGERCTVFMAKELVPYLQKGVPREDLIAGLALSVAQNYLNRVVKKRPLGKTIFFQGGTAYNDSVAAAFSVLLGREIIVPPHNGIMGAIGAALLARDWHSGSGGAEKKTRFRGWRLDPSQWSLREFTCRACSNHCAIQEYDLDGEKSYWGDKCSDRYRKRTRTDRKPVVHDLVRFREGLLKPHQTPAPRSSVPLGRAGIPLSLFFHDRLPFWKTYLETLGFETVLSGPTTPSITSAGIEACVNEPCFPLQAALGHLSRLMDEDVDFVFFPNVVNEEDPVSSVASFLCPWVQTLPLVAGHTAMLEAYRDRIFFPRVHFREGARSVEDRLFREAGKWKISRSLHRAAVNAAYRAQAQFRSAVLEKGKEALKTLSGKRAPAVVLAGRPYNLYDPGMNLNLPQKLSHLYGANVIPMDFLPIDTVDIRPVNDHMFWNYGRRILQASRFVRDFPDFQLIYLSNFKCGPDSYIRHYVEEAAGKPFLFLQLDAHSNDAGVMTRVEAFLESKGML